MLTSKSQLSCNHNTMQYSVSIYPNARYVISFSRTRSLCILYWYRYLLYTTQKI